MSFILKTVKSTKKYNIKINIIVLLLVLILPLISFSKQLPVQYEGQETGEWCGEAAIVAILNRYGTYPVYVQYYPFLKYYWGQCVVARYINDAGCCTESTPPAACEDGVDRPEMVDAFDHWGLEATDYNDVISEQEVATEIAAGRPFNMHFSYGHWQTCTGAYMVGNDLWLWIMNTNGGANGGYWTDSYDNVILSGWNKTVVIDLPVIPPDDVYLRHTINRDNYTYESEGTIYIYDFTVTSEKTTVEAEESIEISDGFEVDSSDDAGF